MSAENPAKLLQEDRGGKVGKTLILSTAVQPQKGAHCTSVGSIFLPRSSVTRFCLHEFPGRATRAEPLLPTKGPKVEAGVGTHRRAWKATFSQAKVRNPEVSIIVKEAQSTVVRTRGTEASMGEAEWEKNEKKDWLRL